jgi:hypothetical protein
MARSRLCKGGFHVAEPGALGPLHGTLLSKSVCRPKAPQKKEKRPSASSFGSSNSENRQAARPFAAARQSGLQR